MLSWWPIGGNRAGRKPSAPDCVCSGASSTTPPGVSLLNRRIKSRPRQSGQAMVEVALMAPWIFLLFIGVFSFGFFAYSIICIQNAARAAAVQTAADATSQSDAIACSAALLELNFMPNVVGVTTCVAAPVTVTRTTRCGNAVSTVPECTLGTATSPPPSDADSSKTASPDQHAASSFIAVTYQTIPLIPIPGVLPGRLTITRTAEMRIIDE